MTADSLTGIVRQLLSAHDHVVTARQLKAIGLTTNQIARLVSQGRLLRLRRDVLVDADWWSTLSTWERHVPRARGVLRSLDPAGTGGFALSHHSALALHGVALHGVDDDVHLVRTTPGRGHRSTNLQVHVAIGPEHLVNSVGLPVVRPAPAVLQVAAASGVEAGLVSVDHALRGRLCTREQLRESLDRCPLRVGRPFAAVVVEHADGRHESAGESRTAWAAHLLGYRGVEPQVTIRTPQGQFVARVDFLLGRVVIEFDGMSKYDDPAVLRAEKRREDMLRSLGYQVVRITWAELADLPALRRKIDAALTRAA